MKAMDQTRGKRQRQQPLQLPRLRHRLPRLQHRLRLHKRHRLARGSAHMKPQPFYKQNNNKSLPTQLT
jgi:hypothetical protein